jgi:type 1 glutamine amidotransferase
MAALRMAAVLGDYYHTPEAQRAAIEKTAGGLGAEVDVFLDPRGVPWDSLSRWAVLIMAREGRVAPTVSPDVWFTAAHERAVSEFVRGGGALVCLHAGLSMYGHDGVYGRTSHGSFINHPVEHPDFHIRPTRAVHQVTRGVKEFPIRDEMYFVRVDSAETTILMESWSPDYGSSAAAWAHQIGAGRVFCFTPGHRDEVLASPSYLAVLENGLRWAAGMP